ncbi:hypothetical protein QJS04_geneDACA007831 [Acorus gramineus]|uniref:Uncharacterized protein n=1 Tax=Acorus gramineus TaxID=55184 RepID=A0AAV9B906_ACOGR|nr:hypothetical protein QJS04_geneDACA007831 [Acorus gramineus]
MSKKGIENRSIRRRGIDRGPRRGQGPTGGHRGRNQRAIFNQDVEEESRLDRHSYD